MSTIIAGRKVRADAKLEHLNAEQRERLHFLFEENWSYSEVIRLIHAEFGISVSRSTVSAYYRRHVLSVQQEEAAEVVTALAALPTADFDKATLQRAKALLWSALASINPDVELAVKLSGIIDKVERRALVVRKLELEERKVAVKEKRAAERVAKAERRDSAAEVGTTKGAEKMKDETGEIGKRGKAEESAGTGGRSEGSEVAAKAQSCEGRSEGTEAANLPREMQNLPRFRGYSGVVRIEGEAEVARELRESARIETPDEEPRNTRKDTKGAEESAGAVGRDGGAEVAAKALSCEGRSEGPEKAAVALAPKEVREAEIAAALGRKEILPGMTTKQVVAAWGQPHGCVAELRDYRRYDIWTYRSDVGETRVCFDGRVVLNWTTDASEKKAKA